MTSEDVKYEITKYWDEGYNAFQKKAQSMFPSIDFSIIQPNEKDETSFVEGDEGAPQPAEGAPLEPVLPKPNLLEQVPAAANRDVSIDPRIEEEVDQCPLEERAQIVDLMIPYASTDQPLVEDVAQRLA
ncbi:hypothetical protein U1Q18_045485 [Sarracenia purpurea var. burkii]